MLQASRDAQQEHQHINELLYVGVSSIVCYAMCEMFLMCFRRCRFAGALSQPEQTDHMTHWILNRSGMREAKLLPEMYEIAEKNYGRETLVDYCKIYDKLVALSWPSAWKTLVRVSISMHQEHLLIHSQARSPSGRTGARTPARGLIRLLPASQAVPRVPARSRAHRSCLDGPHNPSFPRSLTCR